MNEIGEQGHHDHSVDIVKHVEKKQQAEDIPGIAFRHHISVRGLLLFHCASSIDSLGKHCGFDETLPFVF
jgi:hypothetical protein